MDWIPDFRIKSYKIFQTAKYQMIEIRKPIIWNNTCEYYWIFIEICLLVLGSVWNESMWHSDKLGLSLQNGSWLDSKKVYTKYTRGRCKQWRTTATRTLCVFFFSGDSFHSDDPNVFISYTKWDIFKKVLHTLLVHQ